MDVIDVAVACGIGSGIIVAVKVGEIRGVTDTRGRTIVGVGEIGIGAGAQEARIKAIMRRFDVHFIFSPRRKKNAKKPKSSRNLKKLRVLGVFAINSLDPSARLHHFADLRFDFFGFRFQLSQFF